MSQDRPSPKSDGNRCQNRYLQTSRGWLRRRLFPLFFRSVVYSLASTACSDDMISVDSGSPLGSGLPAHSQRRRRRPPFKLQPKGRRLEAVRCWIGNWARRPSWPWLGSDGPPTFSLTPAALLGFRSHLRFGLPPVVWKPSRRLPFQDIHGNKKRRWK